MVLMCASSFSTLSAAESDHILHGVYLGANIGYGKFDRVLREQLNPTDKIVDKQPVYSFQLGYLTKINSKMKIGFEAGYNHRAFVEVETNNDRDKDFIDNEISQASIDLFAVVQYDLNQNFYIHHLTHHSK